MRHRDTNVLPYQPTNVPAKQVFLNDEKEASQMLRFNIISLFSKCFYIYFYGNF